MQNEATLRDALIELDNLRRRDERMRFQSETLQKALELLACNKPGMDTLSGIFEGICRVTSSERGILVSSRKGHFNVVGSFGGDLDALCWDELPLFGDFDVEEARCFYDLNRIDAWPDKFRSALLNFRSALYGNILIEKGYYSILLLKQGTSKYPPQISALFKRHLSLLKQAAAQAEAASRQIDMERDLLEAQKLEAVGQLAGGIAHEINTPAQYIGDNLKFLTDAHKDLFSLVDKSMALTDAARNHDDFSAMAGDIDTVREKIDLDYLREEIPSATEQSLSGVEQVSRIVMAMKEFSHPGAREKSFADINRALENTITISRNEWKHVAELTKDFDAALPEVSCLLGELNQVFLNLIVNAAHAIADKPDSSDMGLINLSTRSDGEYVTVRVADNGTGIPKNLHDKVFNPFFTTKDVGQGTGQGLAIARDIVVKKHGGKIFFETEPGQGTTFVIRLPISDQAKISKDLL